MLGYRPRDRGCPMIPSILATVILVAAIIGFVASALAPLWAKEADEINKEEK